MSYWDTSALAKLYAAETDSADFVARSKITRVFHISRLTHYELRATLRRKEAEAAIGKGEAASSMLIFEGDIMLGDYILHEETGAVRSKYEEVLEKCYTHSLPVFVRTADAIHIATALAAGETEFITADARQKNAAEVCGLTVQP